MSDHTWRLGLRGSLRDVPNYRRLSAEALEHRRLLSVSDGSPVSEVLASLAGKAATLLTTPSAPAVSAEAGQLLVQAQPAATAAPLQALADPASLSFALTSLDQYVAAPDSNYNFSIARTFTGQGFDGYVLKLTSQQWRSSSEVDRTKWEHWLIIAIPHLLRSDSSALLAISGSNNGSTTPPAAFGIPELGTIATATQTVVAELRMVPNQPLTFTADGEQAATFVVPASMPEPVELNFRLDSGFGGSLFSFGFYDTASVTADPILAKQEYAVQAISNGTLLFDERVDAPGSTKSVVIPAGVELGFYIIPNDTPANFLANPSAYFLGGRPAPLFSLPSANPGQLDQMRVAIATGSTRLMFEDISRVLGGTSNFTDVQISIDQELQPVLAPPGSDFVGLARDEDEVIAYTFDRFLATGDETWPALLPMVKSAVRAMDAVQQFVPAITGGALVRDFVVGGGSKRGWTTWLTAAVDAASADPRVKAIVPMVFDMLNMGQQLSHHKEFYEGVTTATIDGYASALQDYTALDIMDQLETPRGQQLLSIVDPYAYRDRLTIPKLMINSTGDEFFVPDSGQFYLDDLPGQNYVRYVPNTGHNLFDNSDAEETLIAYYDAIANDLPLPEFTWSVEDGGKTIRVNTVDTPLAVNIWQATSYGVNDFRRSVTGIPWISSPLPPQPDGSYLAQIPEPNIGSTAFMVELTFPGNLVPFKFTTRVSVLRAVEKPTVQPPLVPELIDDVNDQTLDSNPINLTAVNDTLYFTRDDPTHGIELWKSNGTSGAAVLVSDIYPGPGSSNPHHLTNVGGILYFSAYHPETGQELWKTDGSPEGTLLVANSRPDFGGPNGSYPDELAALGGMLFYSAFDDQHGRELWSTDGSTEGTRMVANMRPDSFFSRGSYPMDLTNVAGRLLFSADDGLHGRELWWSDGTTEGTHLVADIWPETEYGYPQGSTPSYLTALGPTLYFTAFDQEHGRELWKSDGTAEGTVLVADIDPTSFYGDPRSSIPADLTVVGEKLFFTARDELHGRELWKTDGTAEGTVLVADISIDSSGAYIPSSYPAYLTALGGKLFFSAEDYDHGRQLWMSDGTAEGTLVVSDSFANATSTHPSELTVLAGKLYFVAFSDEHGRELWTTDGTTEGTTIVANLRQDDLSYLSGSYPADLTVVGGKLFFSAHNDEVGRELWLTTGSEASTKLVADLNTATPGSYPKQFTQVNGIVYFTAADEHGYELWRSNVDGTDARLVMDINPGSQGSYPSKLTSIGGILYFTANDQTHGIELWKTDGTAEGTVLVKDIHPPTAYNPYLGSDPNNLVAFGGLLYFTANDGQHGRELWRSDGTELGTVMVADIFVPQSSGWILGSYPAQLTAVGGILYFTADDALHGRELWKSDGTAEGTVLVKDIRTITGYGSVGNSHPYYLTAVGGTLYFTARDDQHGIELWKSDGTAEGTVLVSDIHSGSPNDSSYPAALVNFGGELFFSAYHPDFGRELWKSDGTPEGTQLVKDLEPGVVGSDPSNPTLASGKLFFIARHFLLGLELWTSDGTALGTTPVKDINPGPAGSDPQHLTSVGDKLFFVANDARLGARLWQSDGTSAGTAMIRGPRGLNTTSFVPTNLANVGGTLFFSGPSPWIGQEPYILVQPVEIDIQPGSATRGTNRDISELVQVVVHGSATFDASSIDTSTLALAGAPAVKKLNGEPRSSRKDINRDGSLDLVVWFDPQDLQLATGDTSASHGGKLLDGQRVRGSDLFRLDSPPGSDNSLGSPANELRGGGPASQSPSAAPAHSQAAPLNAGAARPRVTSVPAAAQNRLSQDHPVSEEPRAGVAVPAISDAPRFRAKSTVALPVIHNVPETALEKAHQAPRSRLAPSPPRPLRRLPDELLANLLLEVDFDQELLTNLEESQGASEPSVLSAVVPRARRK